MLLQLLIFLFGLVILYYGAEWLIRGAASLALDYGIRPIVVGLTVVALGTSMPEFVVNFFAALTREDNLALGNIVGSNICNIALILGLSALVLPLVVEPATVRREYPLMLGVMLLFWAIAYDGTISQLDGLLLLSGLAGFMYYLYLDSRPRRNAVNVQEALDIDDEEVRMAPWKKAALLVGGTVFLAFGARLMVFAAVSMAEFMGIDPVVVGLTVVAIGTSLPELATSVIGAVRRETDMAVGNILGSNMLNVLFVVGLVAVIQPLRVEAELIRVHFPIMLIFTVALFPIVWTHYKITRVEGGILLTGFFGYMAYIVAPYILN
jgi:cation:H+ antiporter